jgi:hypothetical protein
MGRGNRGRRTNSRQKGDGRGRRGAASFAIGESNPTLAMGRWFAT